LKEPPSKDVFVDEALECVQEAAKENIPLRLLGGIPIYVSSRGFDSLWSSLGREVFSDIDFMTHSRFASKIPGFFQRRGYSYAESPLGMVRKRLTFTDGAVPEVDVFFDRLEMCHSIDLRNRLEIDYPALPLADLLLQKLQIVQINEKDIKDIIVLLRAHQFGEGDRDEINSKYIVGLLSGDWGFHHTATLNLDKVRRYLDGCEVVTDGDRNDVLSKIEALEAALQASPKSARWKMRARIGTTMKWYQDVDEIR
jgi:hypothetical protein